MDYGELMNKLRSADDDLPGRFAFSAGILLCGRIERYLKMCNASGQKLNAWCGKGWFERDWIVRGSVRELRSFALWLGRL
jgi:hypothetical protein